MISLTVNAQKKEIKDKFKDYTENNVYQIDGDNIVVSAVISDIEGSKDEIYIKVKNYLTRAYKDANSVIQTDDKEQGIIIGKGYYGNVYAYKIMGIPNTILKCYHILRIDIKENRIRVICSTDLWEVYNGEGEHLKDVLIKDYAPITDKRFFDKGKQMEAFIALIDRMHNTIDAVEKTVKEGGLSIENEDW